MAWQVVLNESVLEDLRYFGKKEGRKILRQLQGHLAANPLEQSRNMKSLRPNDVAQRELRLPGKYRVLFNVDEAEETVTVVLVGEKRGNSLFVRGDKYEEHHESDSAQ